ncbi:MAG TPA: ABC-F family ATP-binding cassette domain-containing protein [Chlamydiales bacterium]|nr:ABC-F family ATP-binding cassette domain-containing protein [Chlamydiales bacterium]
MSVCYTLCMTLLCSCQSLSKSYGARLLFKDLSLSIFEKDRIGLIGPNGSGKTTLLNILADLEKADSGMVSPRRGLKIGYLPQSCDFPDQKPTDILLEAIRNDRDIPDYDQERLAETILSKLGFSGEELSAAHLSGGWKKRLGLAKELIREPDLLLLDEPTNHLDLEGILWLEKFLSREAPTYLLVSHDRYFLQNVTNRIIEIDSVYPRGIFAIDGTYANFLTKKGEFLEGQIQQERSLASKARREEEWLSRSAKARTTKSQSRIDEANEILGELSQIQKRNRQKKAGVDFVGSERETRKLLVAKNLAKEINRPLFRHLDLTLSPGTRIGLMGPNGSGKTTLLRLFAGELEPDQGTIKRADDLKIVYFDQHRAKLPLTLTLREALSPNGDYVLFRGQPIHVNGWCKRFLFSPDILDLSISRLSGGERARISIAHLMLQPADLLLLDEPTNDLDIPTLETLEESLLDFPGALVLITHDRCMLDRICNSLLSLGDPDRTFTYSDYSQWEEAQKNPPPKDTAPKKKAEPTTKAKLSYLEKREYEQIETTLAKLEEEIKQLNHLLENPEIAQNAQKLSEVCTAIGLAETQVERLYLRWAELDQKLRST